MGDDMEEKKEHLRELSEIDSDNQNKRKCKRRLFSFLVIIFVVALSFMFWLSLSLIYSRTTIPDNLSSEETVQLFFEYWDSGNLKGKNLLQTDYCASEYVIINGAWVSNGKRKEIKWNDSFSFQSFIDNIKITDIYKCEAKPDWARVYSFAECEVYAVTYYKSIDEGWQGLSAGRNFTFVCVCKENENSPWRIESFFTGW